ncbi:hypothetical protein HOF65_01515 [bacterium]|nr:hypothetical protein [bacterium]MBT3852706.1 hypothetical protein [bacterium]MBT4633238.1 hypothetical protein [bacterium]
MSPSFSDFQNLFLDLLIYQFVKLSINLTIGLVALFNLYSSNHSVTSLVNSFNSEINHLSRLLFLVLSQLGLKLSILA